MTEHSVQSPHPLVEAHHSLMEAVDGLEKALRRPGCSASQLARLLAFIRLHTLDHFRLEEEGGYMKEVLEQHPFLARNVAKLLHEHGVMAAALDRIIEKLEHASDSSARTRRKPAGREHL
jgi:hemerythrin-like domain-containing protein